MKKKLFAATTIFSTLNMVWIWLRRTQRSSNVVTLGDVIDPTKIHQKTIIMAQIIALGEFNNRGTIESILYSIHFQKLNRKMINYQLWWINSRLWLINCRLWSIIYWQCQFNVWPWIAEGYKLQSLNVAWNHP